MKPKTCFSFLLLFVFWLEITTASPVNAAIRIMPLGDSLTQGEGSGIFDEDFQVAYREALWGFLDAAGYNVDLVGSQDMGSEVFDDSQHEGVGGRKTDETRDGIYNWLVAYPAEIILLHIGTNNIGFSLDLNDVTAEVYQILDEIARYESDYSVDITVILALIINRKDYTCGSDSETTTFNNLVNDMAMDRIAVGDRIEIVDMECGAGIDYRDETVGGDMYSGNDLHPVESGYIKMADLWFSGFQAIQPSADAGSNQSVNESDLVTLDGSNSSDHFGDPVSYEWIQTNGTVVGLSDSQSAMPTFTAPDVGSGGDTLTFQLTVTDPSGLEDTAITSVDVSSSGGSTVNTDSGGGGGCFIATAAYGSLMDPHVKILRKFRDRFMKGNPVGKKFMLLYYTYSPPIAHFIAKHDRMRKIVRLSLLPLIGVSWVAVKMGLFPTVGLMLILGIFLSGRYIVKCRVRN